MKRVTVLLFVCFWLAWPQFVPAQTHDELIERYIRLSGAGDALISFPEQLEASMTQQLLVSKNPEMEKKVMDILVGAYDLSTARDDLKNYLREHADPGFLRELLQWLETPLARAISAEEKKASSPDSQSAMVRYINELRQIPPSPERIRLIRGVEEATQISDVTAKIVLTIMRGAAKSFNAILPPEKRESEENIDKKINLLHPTIKEAFRKQMTLSSYYTYRNISDEGLAAYIEFYQSDLGKKEIETTGNAFCHVLEQWFAVAGKEMADLAKEEVEKKKRELDVKNQVPQTKTL